MFDQAEVFLGILKPRWYLRCAAPDTRSAVDQESRETDEAIVSQILRRNIPAKFGIIVGRYRGKLTALARTTLAGSSAAIEAEDAVQDAFVAAYDHLYSFRESGTFRPWLYKILLNCCMDRLRSARRTVSSTVELDRPDPSHSPMETLILQEDARRIQAAVEKLPSPQRILFLLRYNDDLTYQELSQITGQPIGTVKTNLFRARERVQQSMKEEPI